MDPRGLFESQLRVLAESGHSHLAVNGLRRQRDSVLARASSLVLGECDFPFMPILVDWPMLEIMPRYKNDEGEIVVVNPKYINDIISIPKEPYYIFGVDIGKTRQDWQLSQAVKWIEENGRCALTVNEVLSFSIFTDMLRRGKHDTLLLMALGSLFDAAYYPFIYPGPKLHYFTSLDVKTSSAYVPSRLF